MHRKLCLLAALTLCASSPARANGVVAPTYEELMAQSNLVVIGTVMTTGHADRDSWGSMATLSVHSVLKGEAPAAVTVWTWHPVAELDPRCCEVGATYLMFLRSSATDGPWSSVRGVFGMVRIAGPQQPYVVLPTREGRRRN